MTAEQARIMRVWADLDDGDISTERLIAMTAEVAKVDHDAVMDALDAEVAEKGEGTGE